MESSILFPPVKRPIYTASTTTMHEPNTTTDPSPSAATSSAPTISGGVASAKRNKPPQPPLYIPQGHVAFRLLCHASRIGGLIGKSGSIIKQLQQLTGSKIRVEDPVDSSDQRVISVLSSAAVIKKIKIRAGAAPTDEEENNGFTIIGDDGEEEEEWFEVSAAQEGIVKVFERVVEVAAAEEDVTAGIGGVVSCRLLAWKNQAGAVIGKGGKVVEKIRIDTGCRIKVLSLNMFSPGSFPADEIVEIEGNVLAVKRALVFVTSRLQECPPLEKPRTYGTRPIDAEPSPITNVDLPFQRGPLPQSTSSNSTHPSSSGSDNVSNMESSRTTTPQEVVFRILCFNERVGCIIGKGGSIIRALQNDSGANISVGPTVPDCDERLIYISAMESVESKYSPAQNAAVLVFNRSTDPSLVKGLDSDSKGSPVSARVLVPAHQVGCLLGKGGAIISEIRKMTGAALRIFGGNQVPKCVSDDCEVLQITGEFANVRDALYKVMGRLRDNVFATKMLTGNGNRNSFRNENSSYEHKSLTQSFGNLGISNNTGQSPTQNVLKLDNDGKLPSVKGGIELGSGSRSAFVTNTTVEIVVPDNVFSSIYGENGSNLTRLRQISGAKVIIHEPRPGTNQRTVIISGTPDETQAAQSLLQAFILAGS